VIHSDPSEAPGKLEPLRLLVNTATLPDGPDELESLEAASAWCRRHGFPALSNEREHDRLRAFREALREVLYANNGEAEPEAAWGAMRAAAGAIAARLAIDPQKGPLLEPGGAGVERIVAVSLCAVYDAIADGTWARLRACKRADCRYAYYDRSKNGTRAWCSMATCGNREKAQRRRARERA